jgi:hypothetical protein
VDLVRAAEWADPDSADPDSVGLCPVDRDLAGPDRVGLAPVDRDRVDRERATSAQESQAVRVKVVPAALVARESQAAGAARHRESELRALRAPARVRWPSKPA